MDSPLESGCDLRIGTSGYDYPDWEGELYRHGLGRSEYLGAYSEAFDTLELDYPLRGGAGSGSAPPLSPAEAVSRARRPMDVTLRAAALSGSASPAAILAAVRELAAAAAPLAEAGTLCALLLPFSFSFRYGDDERRALDRALRELAAFPVAVELLNAEWLNARAIDGLKARRVCLCAVDLPRIDGLPPVSDLVTSDLACVRFHGRDGEAWLAGDRGSRAGYRYSRDELGSWLPRLEAMSVEARKLRVYFVNRRGGAAPAGARELLSLARSFRLL